MITVRFPNGFSIRYNTATFVTRHSEYSDLLTAKDGTWVAQVPNSALIELVTPCHTFNPLIDTTHYRMARIEKELRALTRQIKGMKK